MSASTSAQVAPPALITNPACFSDTSAKEIPACGLELGYRRSIFSSREGAVLAAEIALEPREAGEIRDRMEELGLAHQQVGAVAHDQNRPRLHFGQLQQGPARLL